MRRHSKLDANFMAEKDKAVTTTDDENVDEPTVEDTEAETGEDADTDENDSQDSSKEDEIDYDAELEAEQKRGKPDPSKAREAFKERDNKRDTDADDDKPLTRKDIADVEARVERRVLAGQALDIARKMAGSDKEAQLIVAKWTNRTFPAGTTLQDQIEEAYVITHSKRLIGTTNEAMRALKNKNNVRTGAAGATHRDSADASEPKMNAADAASYKGAGFVWNGQKRVYMKSLKNGKMFLYKDPKTKKQWTAAA